MTWIYNDNNFCQTKYSSPRYFSLSKIFSANSLVVLIFVLANMTCSAQYATLNTGAKMPLVGYGTWQALDDELENALNEALEIGYRHIDTAYVYRNEHVIGKVLKQWITSGKLKREEIFITTKLPPFGNRPELVEKYLNASLTSLQLDYLDMYLIHGPFGIAENEEKNPDGTIKLDLSTDHVALWKAMEAQLDAGKTKAIGISNFNESQIARLLPKARTPPANLQVELHVYLQQKSLVELCKKNNIIVTSYSTLGSGGTFKLILQNKEVPNLFENEIILKVAKKTSRTPAQILLRYFVQQGIVVIPKSTNPKRIKENFQLLDFNINEEDMAEISQLDKGPYGRRLNFKDLVKGAEKHPEYPFPELK